MRHTLLLALVLLMLMCEVGCVCSRGGGGACEVRNVLLLALELLLLLLPVSTGLPRQCLQD